VPDCLNCKASSEGLGGTEAARSLAPGGLGEVSAAADEAECLMGLFVGRLPGVV